MAEDELSKEGLMAFLAALAEAIKDIETLSPKGRTKEGLLSLVERNIENLIKVENTPTLSDESHVRQLHRLLIRGVRLVP